MDVLNVFKAVNKRLVEGLDNRLQKYCWSEVKSSPGVEVAER